MVACVRRPLRVATFLSPALEQLYRLLGERAAAALERDLVFTAPGGYDQLEPDLVDGAFVCGPPSLARADRFVPVAAPVLDLAGTGGRPVYWSEVVVADGRPWRSFADLRGATLAYNEPESWSGHHCLRAHLVALGETAGFFAATVEAGSHRRALAMVADGRADVAAVDVHLLALARRAGEPAAVAVRAVTTTAPVPVQPVVVSRRLSPGDRAAVAAAMVRASDDPVVAASLVARIVAVGPDHAEPLRPLLAAADAAGIDLRTRHAPAAWA